MDISEKAKEEMQKIMAGADTSSSDIAPPKFDARTADWESFLQDLYDWANFKNWGYERLAKALPCLLEGEAKAIFRALPPEKTKDWKSITTAMAQEMKRFDASTYYMSELASRRQGYGESEVVFGLEIERLTKKAAPLGKGFTETMQEQLATSFFINGLRSQLKQDMLLLKPQPTTLSAAIAEAKRLSQIHDAVSLARRAELYYVAANDREAEVKALRAQIHALQLQRRSEEEDEYEDEDEEEQEEDIDEDDDEYGDDEEEDEQEICRK